ncbi:MAG: VanZ family protein [Eubacteriales bacterium]|nr:VanZ family protein [Eubacteriales bacterium]
MFKDIYFTVYALPLYVVIFLMVAGVICWMICGVLMTRKKIGIWRFLNVFLCAVSIVVVAYFTLMNRTGNRNDLILRPFYSFVEAREQPEVYRSMLMNVFLFLPFGLTAPFAISNGKTGRKYEMAVIRHTVLSAIIFSVLVEGLQYIFQLGRTETDDVICNVLGTVIGTISFGLCERMRRKGNKRKKNGK